MNDFTDKSVNRWLTLSNGLTFLRIGLTPFIVMGIVHRSWDVVFSLILVAALTDFFDGHLARWRDEQTILGTYLDPIADKILLVSSFASLSFVDSPSFSIPFWFVLLVFMRETIIIGGSFILFVLGIKFKVMPSIWGKLTTFFQLTFILWLFICYFVGWSPIRTYSVLLVLLAIFSLISLVHYGIIGVRYLELRQSGMIPPSD
jgi:cardiolipin synthase